MKKVTRTSGPRLVTLVACGLSLLLPVWAADPAGSPAAADASPNTPASTSTASEIEQLKRILIDQQQQINDLRQKLAGQQPAPAATPQSAAAPAALPSPAKPADSGLVASTTPVVPNAVPSVKATSLPLPVPQKDAGAATTSSSNPCEANPEAQIPTYFRIGGVCLVPIGFMDLTSIWRDKNAGSGIGTNFGSVPYNNTTNAMNSEFRFSPQNSRIGFRVDGDWKGAHFIGYNEFDFLGTSASLSLTVTNGAFVPRLRLFWVDVRKGPVEFLAGQSWSMLTPNRSGISPLPGNIFYSQVMDVNYVAGLTWTRQPGVRILFHGGSKTTFGLSFENPDQYIGGSAGGSGITLPANTSLAGLAGTQLDNAPSQFAGPSTVLAIPTVNPDIIAKLAFDPSTRFHFEVGGIERTFKIWNPNTTGPGALQHFSAVGGGALIGANAEIFKNFRLITTNYWSDGGGRYLFGQAPDLIVRTDGSISPVRAGGTVDGFETRVNPNLLLFGYYGGIFIDRNVTLDTNGKPIGYGYAGSPNSQNKAINEVTFGFNQTIWGNARYGALNLIGQYEYLTRDPWAVAVGAPKATHDNTIYMDVRYTLPGNMPSF